MNNEIAEKVRQALTKEMLAQKINLRFLSYFLPQIALETGGFKSKVSIYKNYGGIKHSKNGFSYDSGIKPPEGGANYAGYTTDENFAKDYLRIIKRNGGLEATSANDFIERMKEKGYFHAKLEDYKKAFFSWYPQLKRAFLDLDFSEKIKQATKVAKENLPIIALVLLTTLIIIYAN
jgi:hypothetical protein